MFWLGLNSIFRKYCNGPFLTDGGELTTSYTIENGEVKMSKQELIAMIENAGFEAVERDTVYYRVEKVAA